MKITILTPSYNQGRFIEQNILSVLHQKDVEVEHIVIDGGSTDSTLDILKRYSHLVWLSEKDEGQSDALQKGLNLSTGDVIGWINSDDYLAENVLGDVVSYFRNEKLDWLIGNLTFLDQKSGIFTADKSMKISKSSLLSCPDNLRQQATFFRKSSILKTGGFRKEFHLTMDIDLWFRMLKLSEPLMVDRNLAFFRVHEDQKTSAKDVIFPQLRELLIIYKRNNAPIYYFIKLIFRKLYINMKMKLGYFRRKYKII